MRIPGPTGTCRDHRRRVHSSLVPQSLQDGHLRPHAAPAGACNYPGTCCGQCADSAATACANALHVVFLAPPILIPAGGQRSHPSRPQPGPAAGTRLFRARAATPATPCAVRVPQAAWFRTHAHRTAVPWPGRSPHARPRAGLSHFAHQTRALCPRTTVWHTYVERMGACWDRCNEPYPGHHSYSAGLDVLGRSLPTACLAPQGTLGVQRAWDRRRMARLTAVNNIPSGVLPARAYSFLFSRCAALLCAHSRLPAMPWWRRHVHSFTMPGSQIFCSRCRWSKPCRLALPNMWARWTCPPRLSAYASVLCHAGPPF